VGFGVPQGTLLGPSLLQVFFLSFWQEATTLVFRIRLIGHFPAPNFPHFTRGEAGAPLWGRTDVIMSVRTELRSFCVAYGSRRPLSMVNY
jgi:hypothetical protein